MCFVVVQHTDNDLFYIRQVEENLFSVGRITKESSSLL